MRLPRFAIAALAAVAVGCGPIARTPSTPLPPPPRRERPRTLDEAYTRVKDARDVRSVFAALGRPDEIVGRGVTQFVYVYRPEGTIRIGARDAQPESPVLYVDLKRAMAVTDE